jgi:uncharacterized membrane protein
VFSFLFRKKEFFTPPQRERIVEAIRINERRTSGEIRVFVESRCPMVDALDRAFQVFYRLQMEKTEQRNAVLVYVAIKDRQLAIFGDQGIHEKVGTDYWNKEVKKMIALFNKNDYAEGIRQCVLDVGESLHQYFPFDNDTDKNELPDDIVFGD